PYPHAGQHQELNAQFLVERGAAIRISNADLERALLPTITRVLNAPEELQKMRAAMRALAAPDAAKKIARLIQSVAAC
ncbi:MAG: UDP-N-acetylglucosamine--N-acetylmuramyl-(pentapeptide) pyrophosphoryl-undecaprenol N-acetylglucosamine transferase, partial [Chloroflexi bacterium]|nr:UDP-N-acetylglucosamine--N-acetylmuramyl-(pentapeptide) pyrophosphoryl-undecaprenol N-acetylglucosamine transferase [Chloroflexota bacterium]